jgi:hypothetical protein
MPAQTVDATVSIDKCFPGWTHLFGLTRSKPSQGSALAVLT